VGGSYRFLGRPGMGPVEEKKQLSLLFWKEGRGPSHRRPYLSRKKKKEEENRTSSHAQITGKAPPKKKGKRPND